jgi:hypothetical protein
LNIAKAIIDSFGGTIGFVIEDGVGTTFFFELSAIPGYALQPAVTAASSPLRMIDQNGAEE